MKRIALLAGALALMTGCGGSNDAPSAPAGSVKAAAAPAGQDWTQTVSQTPEGGFVAGNPDAPLKLVEYGSLTCPACARFSEEGMKPLLEKYVNSGRVSFEFRSFLIHGPLDLALTRLIGCTAPEAAVPLADQIWANLGAIQQRAYANESALADLNKFPENERFVRFGELTGLYEFFAARGISEDQARTCMADFASLEKLSNISETYSTDDKITQTPTFVLNGSKVEASTWAELEPKLQRAGAR